MTHDDVTTSRVTALLVQRLGLQPEAVTPSAELAEDLGVDSVDSVEFTVALEREFNVTLPDTALTDVRTVQDVIQLVRECLEVSSQVLSD